MNKAARLDAGLSSGYFPDMSNRVHQVVFSDQGVVSLQDYAKKAARSVQQVFADYDYRCWYLQDATDFIRANFPDRVLAAFETLVPFAYKADLFKYCLLKVLGGWYVDIGVTMLKDPLAPRHSNSDTQFVFFRATGPWDPLWACSVALIYAQPGHAVFDTAIASVVAHCEQRFYGANPLMPAMVPLGSAIAEHQIHENAKIGNVVDVRKRKYRRGYQLKPGELVARRKPPRAKAGDVASIGISGANNHVELWHQRQVYGEGAVCV